MSVIGGYFSARARDFFFLLKKNRADRREREISRRLSKTEIKTPFSAGLYPQNGLRVLSSIFLDFSLIQERTGARKETRAGAGTMIVTGKASSFDRVKRGVLSG